MGECGCNLEIGRCGAHKDDVILVLDGGEARSLVSALHWLMGDRAGAAAGVRLPDLKAVTRQLEQGGVPR